MFNNFTDEKKKIVNKLKALNKELKEIENNFGIDISELKEKIKKSIYNVENEKFSISFFGAFSDGKSTILSVFIKSLDIKISPEPTTDKIITYDYNDYLIVDTPGLFSEKLMHDALTKKYISEANIIIYTVDPVNPLKDSHWPTIKWLLKDLKKVDSTIFVINKMDEIADLEDNDDFKKNSQIKREVVQKVLKDITNIENFQRIVCISADPYEMGLEHWFKNKDDYNKLSRISLLENLIQRFIEQYKDDLVLKAGISVIEEIIYKVLIELNEIKNSINDEIAILDNQIEEYENRLSILEKDINKSYINIKEDLISLRENILLEIDAASNLSQLSQTMQTFLGKDGYVIQEQIDLITRKHTENLLGESKKLFTSLEESILYHSNLQTELLQNLSSTGKSVAKSIMSAPTRKIADTVIKARNFTKLPLKFKPWGAIKVAKWLKGLPAIIEFIEIVFKMIGKWKLEKKRNELKNQIENGFKLLFETLNLEKYTENYFPYVNDIVEVINDFSNTRSVLNASSFKLNQIINGMKTLRNWT